MKGTPPPPALAVRWRSGSVAVAQHPYYTCSPSLWDFALRRPSIIIQAINDGRLGVEDQPMCKLEILLGWNGRLWVHLNSLGERNTVKEYLFMILTIEIMENK